MMLAVELMTDDEFLINYNVSIDTNDIMEYMKKAMRVWTLPLVNLNIYNSFKGIICVFSLILDCSNTFPTLVDTNTKFILQANILWTCMR